MRALIQQWPDDALADGAFGSVFSGQTKNQGPYSRADGFEL